MKRLLISIVSAGLAGGLFAAMPSVSDVTLAQDAESGVVTASYTLAGAPAIVTLEILTNGVPIKGSAIVTVEGAANRLLDKDGSYSFTWLADRDVEGLFDTTVTARMSAWRPEDPPDYLVADLITPSNVTYYASADDLPHGVQHFANKTTRLVMRRIRAAGVSWAMGSVGETGRAVANEMVHAVTLAADYWIGVFEITQAQWAALRGGERPSAFKDEGDWAERPVEMVTPAVIRESADYAGNSAYYYPAAPHPDSFLGLLRAKTGIDFDLPGEAQWEYACRAGTTGSTYFGNNVTGDAALLNAHIWYSDNAGGKTHGVGQFPSNPWGLYDTLGNVWEWCRDRVTVAPSHDLGSAAATDPLSEVSKAVVPLRGGPWSNDATSSRCACCAGNSGTLGVYAYTLGFRLSRTLP